MTQFHKLIKEGDIDLGEFKKILNTLVYHFEQLMQKDVVEVLSKLKDCHLYKMIDEYVSLSESGNNKIPLGLFPSTLFERLYNADLFGIITESNIIPCIDSLKGRNTRAMINMINGIIDRKGMFQNMDSLNVYDSKSEKLIQAADLLCGYVNKCFNDFDTEKSMKDTNEFWNDLIFIRDCFCDHKIVVWDYCSSQNDIAKVAQLAGMDISGCKRENEGNIIEELFKSVMKR